MEQSLKEMLYELSLFTFSAIYFAKPKGNKLGSKTWRITFTQTAGGEQFGFHQMDYMDRPTAGHYTPDIDEALRIAQEHAQRELSKSRDFDKDWYPEQWDEQEVPMYKQIQQRAFGRSNKGE